MGDVDMNTSYRFTLVSLFSLLILASCKGKTEPSAPSSISSAPSSTTSKKDISITLSETSHVLKEYESFTLYAKVTNSEDSLLFLSEDSTVATVSRAGVVTGIKEGTTTITASVEGVTATCFVTVVKSDLAPTIKVPNPTLSIPKQSSYSFPLTITWGKEDVTDQSTISVSTSDPNLSASYENRTVALIGKEKGTFTLRILAQCRNVKSLEEIKVTITSQPIVLSPVDQSIRSSLSGFETDLALVDYNGYKTEKSLAFHVFRGNEIDPEATLTYKSSNELVAEISNGTIKAKALGNTMVTIRCSSFGETIESQILIHVVRPVVTLKTKLTIETCRSSAPSPSFDLKDSGLVNQESGNIYLEDSLVGSLNHQIATFDANRFPKEASKLGNKTLTIQTDSFSYQMESEIYSLIIQNKDDLDSMITIARNNNQESYLADGYFVLGNNIEYNGTIENMFDSGKLWSARNSVTNERIENNWPSGDVTGFKGVFDGKGHYISGLTVSPRSGTSETGGIFCTLHTGSVIKNVAFLDATVDAETGFICSTGNGTIDNVYLHFKSIGENKENLWGNEVTNVNSRHYCGAFYTYSAHSGIGNKAKVTHTYIDASTALIHEHVVNTTSNTKSYSIKIAGNSNGLSVSDTVALIQDEDVLRNSMAKYNFSSFEEVKNSTAAKAYLSEFDSTEYQVTDTGFYPLSINEDISTKLEITSSKTRLHPGESTVISLNVPSLFYHLTLSSEDGVSLKGNLLSISDTCSLSSVTLTATSAFDSDNKASLTLPILRQVQTDAYEFNLQESLSSNTLNYGLKNLEFTLPDYPDLGDFVSASLEDETLENVTVNQHQVSLPSASLKTAYGNKEILLKFAHADMLVPIHLITKSISSKEDINSMFALAKRLEPDSKTYGGYFKLTSHIDYNESFDGSAYGMGDVFTWSSQTGNVPQFNASQGFKGTIDGDGYAIKGLSTSSGWRFTSFIAYLNREGTLKNIAFTDYKNANSGTLIGSGSGRVENVFVSRGSKGIVNNTREGIFFTHNPIMGGSPTLKNILVDDSLVTDQDYSGFPTAAVNNRITGVYTGNADISNFYLITRSEKDKTYFAAGNGFSRGSNLISGIYDSSSALFAQTDKDFNTAWDAIWKSGSGVLLSNSTLK